MSLLTRDKGDIRAVYAYIYERDRERKPVMYAPGCVVNCAKQFRTSRRQRRRSSFVYKPFFSLFLRACVRLVVVVSDFKYGVVFRRPGRVRFGTFVLFVSRTFSPACHKIESYFTAWVYIRILKKFRYSYSDTGIWRRNEYNVVNIWCTLLYGNWVHVWHCDKTN